MLLLPQQRMIMAALLFAFQGQGLLGQVIDLSRPKSMVNQAPPPQTVPIIIEDGDTLIVVSLRPVDIQDTRAFKSAREERRWNKLKRDVAKTYPYARLARYKMDDYGRKAEGLSESEKKKLYKQAEKEIRAEFEDDIRGFTLNQGRILLKLIDRETGNTSYALVQDLRGNFQAFFWQSVSRLFSVNLKSQYDPKNNDEDKMIEEIVQSIEDGTFVN